MLLLLSGIKKRENCILYFTVTDRNGGTWEDFLDVARASVSAGALALIQIGQSLKKLSAEYSNLIYSIKLGQLISLTSLRVLHISS